MPINQSSLVDTHCHTEYAYCSAGVSARRNVEISRKAGLAGLCLVEHSFQLYFDEDEAWSWAWKTDDAMVQRAWASGRGRMPDYRAFVQGLRREYKDFIHLGLELDLLADGSLLLDEADRDGWDLLIGSIHQIHDFDRERETQAQAEKLFLRETERLLAQPIDVLAHPFRFLYHAKFKRPPHLHKTVARWLAQSGVATEINFHWNEPDPRFIEMCLTEGVKLALATDSHKLEEVGDLSRHLRLLEQLGVRDQDLSDVFYRPSKSASQ
jgi:histidinol phosphatase-like PHP family hydrolase